MECEMSISEASQRATIASKYSYEFECDYFSCEGIDNFKTDKDFRILKIKNCSKLFELLSTLKYQKFGDIIDETSYLFVIAIETKEIIQDFNQHLYDEMSHIFLRTQRPLLIQLTSCNNRSIIYYKNEDAHAVLKTVWNLSSVDRDDFMKQMSLPNSCNMYTLLRAMKWNHLGQFNGDLLEVTMVESLEKTQIQNLAARNDILCFRFMQLFETNANQNLKLNLSTDLLHSCCIKNIFALLDLPINLKNNIQLSDEQKSFLINFRDNCKLNLLSIAVGGNNVDIVQFLLQNDLFNARDKQVASEIAWDLKYQKCLAYLLKADSPFPENFNREQIDDEDLDTEIKQRVELHSALKTDSIRRVESILSKNSFPKSAYNERNHSAITIALCLKHFDTYAFLKHKGFTAGIDSEYESIMNILSKDEKLKITKANQKYFKSPDNSHVMALLSRTQISSGDENNKIYFEIISKMIEDLNEVPEIQIILMIVAYSDDLKILFDFNHSHIANMDPTKKQIVRGTTYKVGYIYIAAADHTENFRTIVGTLAHELAHYAMYLFYENEFKPHKTNDQKSYDKLSSILKFLKLRSKPPFECHPIIGAVFQYDEQKWHAEIIVRVPQLLAQYKDNPEQFQNIKSRVPSLFKFYQDHTMKDFCKEHDSLKTKNLIREINNFDGRLKTIQASKIRLSEEKLNEASELRLKLNGVLIISSNLLSLAFTSMFQKFYVIDKLNIFLYCSSLKNEDVLLKIQKALNSGKNVNLFVECNGEYDMTGLCTSCCKVPFDALSNQIVLILNPEKCLIMKCFLIPKGIELNSINLNISWADLDKVSKVELFQKHVEFQGHSIKLVDLLPNESFLIENFLLSDLLSDEIISICKPEIVTEKLETKIYIIRKFLVKKLENSLFDEAVVGSKNEKSTNSEMDLAEMTDRAKERKVILLADGAGAGKTTVLKRIATILKEKLPGFWVQFIDLKQHIDEFKKAGNSNTSSFEDLFVLYFLNLKSDIEKKIFHQLFLSGKVVILLDGFDEISPTYKELLTCWLTAFDVAKGNQLWVTTRSHLEHELEEKFNLSSCKLKPWSHEDQEKFLIKFWGLKESKFKLSPGRMKRRAKKLVTKVSGVLSVNGDNSVGLPLLISMTANIYDENDKSVEKLDVSTIYKLFIKNFFKRFSKQKGALALEELLQNLTSPSVMHVLHIHRLVALNLIFPLECNFEYNKEHWPNEKVARYGIISFDGEFARFVHLTFGEFFVADFIQDNIKCNNDELKIVVKLLFQVITVDKMKLIRVFLNESFLNFQLSAGEAQNVACILEKIMEDTDRYELLQNIVKEHHENFVELVVSFMSFFKEETNNQISSSKTDSNENNFMSLAKSGNESILEKVWPVLVRNLDQDIIKQYCKERQGKKEKNVLQLGTLYRGSENFKTLLLSKLKCILTEEELRTEFKESKSTGTFKNLLSVAAKSRNKKNIIALYAFAETVFTSSELKSYIKETDMNGRHLLHIACSSTNKSPVRELLKIISKSLEHDEQICLFQARDNHGHNIFHCTALNTEFYGIFKVLINFVKEFLKEINIKDLLKAKSNSKKTILQILLANGRSSSIKEFFNLASNLLSSDELREMFINNDSKSSKSVFFWKLKNDALLKAVHKMMKRILVESEILAFLKRLNNKDQNSLLYACRSREELIVKGFCEIFEISFSRDELKQLLLSKDSEGQTVLHSIALNTDESITFIHVMKLIKKVFKTKEIKTLIFERNKIGNNVLHELALNYRKNLLASFFKSLKKVVCKHDIKQLLCEKTGKTKSSIFSLMVEAKSESLFKTINGFLKTYVLDDYKTLITDLDIHGRTALCIAGLYCSKNIFKLLCIMFKDSLGVNEVKQFFQARDFEGNNILHYISRNLEGNGIITLFVNFCASEEILTTEELKLMFHQTSEGKNMLVELVENGNEKTLDEIFLIMQRVISKEEQKQLLIESKGEYSRNIFILSAAINNAVIFKKLTILAEVVLSDIEFISIIKAADVNGVTLLHCSCQCAHIFIEILLKIIKEKLTLSLTLTDKIEIFGAKDNDGWNIFHWLATSEHGKGESITMLKNEILCNEILMVEDLTALVTDRTYGGSSVIHIALEDRSKHLVEAQFRLVESLSNAQEMKRLLNLLDSDGANIFMLAALNSSNDEILTTLLNCVKDIFSKQEVKVLLEQKDNLGKNTLLTVLRYNNEKAFAELVLILQDFFTPEEIKKMFQEKSKDNSNVIQLAIQNKKKAVLEALLEKLFTLFTPEDIKDMFFGINEDGKDALQLASNKKNKGNLKNIRVWVCKIYSEEEQIDFLATLDQISCEVEMECAN